MWPLRIQWQPSHTCLLNLATLSAHHGLFQDAIYYGEQALKIDKTRSETNQVSRYHQQQPQHQSFLQQATSCLAFFGRAASRFPPYLLAEPRHIVCPPWLVPRCYLLRRTSAQDRGSASRYGGNLDAARKAHLGCSWQTYLGKTRSENKTLDANARLLAAQTQLGCHWILSGHMSEGQDHL
jgi:hypothetical protein